MDSVSPSFCAAKWKNATIWLGSGTTVSCHLPPAHKIDLNEIKTNPSAIHNTLHKKLNRKKMLEGKRPEECEYCWKIEDMGTDALSDRVFKTAIYSDETVAAIPDLPWDADVVPERLEIAFDRICNLACSYCNASFSTTWLRDLKQKGPYKGLISDGGMAYVQDGSWTEPFGRDNQDNPYIEAFWKWWPALAKELMELRVTGGEPLMSPQFWTLLDRIKEGVRPEMIFSVNSNLCVKDDLIDKLLVQSEGINHFNVYTSCEGYGAVGEYIRDGLDYEKWKVNLQRLQDTPSISDTHVMMTINSLCLFGLRDFLEDIRKIKQRSRIGRHFAPQISANILRFPSFMNPLVLPKEIRMRLKTELENWGKAHAYDPVFSNMEKEKIGRLAAYLENVEDSHTGVSSLESRQKDFKTFYEQYDARRGKDFRKTFAAHTDLIDWYNSL